jgi:LytS/YehU family sensor histidine kinase
VFNYEFTADEKLKAGSIHIPHMLIQPFVENAIWHGLLHKDGEKKLEVSFRYLNEKSLTCIVEDNGVGRGFKKQGAVVLKTKSSLAIEFIRQRLELLSKTTNAECGFEIIDKKDEQGNNTGTLVKITLPILNNV